MQSKTGIICILQIEGEMVPAERIRRAFYNFILTCGTSLSLGVNAAGFIHAQYHNH